MPSSTYSQISIICKLNNKTLCSIIQSLMKILNSTGSGNKSLQNCTPFCQWTIDNYSLSVIFPRVQLLAHYDPSRGTIFQKTILFFESTSEFICLFLSGGVGGGSLDEGGVGFYFKYIYFIWIGSVYQESWSLHHYHINKSLTSFLRVKNSPRYLLRGWNAVFHSQSSSN